MNKIVPLFITILTLLISCHPTQERNVIVIKKVNPWNAFGAPRLVIEDIETHERTILYDDEAPYIYNIGDTIKVRVPQSE